MTLRNFAVGVPAMLLCLVVQIAFVFWCVRYCARQPDQDPSRIGWLRAIRPLAVSMLALLIANVVQIALWGVLFFCLGEFEELYPAIYHSGVNFTSLGYGDVVMSQEWKLLGPLEAAEWHPDDVDDGGGHDGDPTEHHSIAGGKHHRGPTSTSRCRRLIDGDARPDLLRLPTSRSRRAWCSARATTSSPSSRTG